jgi:site-specific DNA-methyltransferase (adenine-specific)
MNPYYSDDYATIYHGDCREVLPTLGRFDLLLTDPPYGAYTHKQAKSNRDKGHGNTAIDLPAIDFPAIDFPAIAELFAEFSEHCVRWCVSFMDYRHVADIERKGIPGWEYVRFGVWVKTNPMPQISADRPAHGWDAICYLHRAGVRKRWNGGGAHGNHVGPIPPGNGHPTQKPVDFMRKTVERFTDAPGDSVLDPFMGSGATLLAAKEVGRNAVGVELSERYCEIAARRLQQGVLPLFEGGS